MRKAVPAIAVTVTGGVMSFAAIYPALGSDRPSELAAALGAKRTEEGSAHLARISPEVCQSAAFQSRGGDPSSLRLGRNKMSAISVSYSETDWSFHEYFPLPLARAINARPIQAFGWPEMARLASPDHGLTASTEQGSCNSEIQHLTPPSLARLRRVQLSHEAVLV
jgi:hypothetical protein